MQGIIDKIFDGTKNGVPNYSIDLIDGKRLYARGSFLNPLPQKGDTINCDVVNNKTSANGNPYTNVENVVVGNPNDQQASYQPPQAPQYAPQPTQPVPQANTTFTPKPPSNGFNKGDTQSLFIFVTGIVGRSMQSGHFSIDDIEQLTKNAVRAFNENLKEL